MPATLPSSSPRLRLRPWLAAVALLATGLGLYLAVAALNALLDLRERLDALSPWLAGGVLLLLAGFAAAGLWVAWRLWRTPPAKPIAAAAATSRPQLEARLSQLDDPPAQPLRAELGELDRRAASGELYVALFGAVSAGKSSLVRALLPEADVDIAVSAGTTRAVRHYRGALTDGSELVLADVPGAGEVDGERRAELARDEAARAHALVFVADADLTRDQDHELRALLGSGRPLLLALNKRDRYAAAERHTLLEHLRQRYAAHGIEVVAVSAGHVEELVRELPNGQRETLSRAAPAEIDELRGALRRIAARGAHALEPARAEASLTRLAGKLDTLEREQRAAQADAIVRRYTRRAVIGALAAVAPGTDLLIQGALATAMLRELCTLHGVGLGAVDPDQLVERAALSVRGSLPIALAIAGNALKAFPGFGTLGGGLVHAFAYGLIFDALGHVVAANLAAQARPTTESTLHGLQAAVQQPSGERVRELLTLVREVVRDQPEQPR